MPLPKEKLESLIAHSTDIVVATDAKGRVIYYNDGATRILGYAPEEILDQFVARLYPDLEEAKNVMQAMRVAGHGGAEDGTIGFAKDLREILRKDQLATLGEVAVGLSHEINNPLAVMLNQIELLEREIDELGGDTDTSVECERLDAMRREIARISAIIGRLGEMVETEHYETIDYVGPAKMIDLRSQNEKHAEVDHRLEGVRILVVDDDIGICSTLKELLQAAGCKVETAHNGAEGLEKVASSHFDVVLSDVVMPNMDGYEFYQAIRERLPELPVLMMTAFHYDKDHIIKRSRLKGLEGVIFKKPVDPERLLEVIAETARGESG